MLRCAAMVSRWAVRNVLGWMAALALGSAAVSSRAHADASLARLFGARPLESDDQSQLVALLAELNARPAASAARPVLDAAQRELAELAHLSARAAPDVELSEAARQCLWAALLLADRLIARSEFGRAIRTLTQRVQQAEAQAGGSGSAPAKALDASDASDVSSQSSTAPPDLAARAVRARADAAHASRAAVRAEHLRRAQRLEVAARAEADRIELERTAALLEQRLAAAIERRATRAAAERAKAATRARAAANAQQQRDAQAAFAALCAPAGPRLRAAGSPHDSSALAQFVLRRATARLAAARILAPQLPELAAADDALRVAAAARGSDTLELAQQSLRLAERALGAARLTHAPASAAQARDLAQNARERGFDAQLLSSGVEVRAAGAWQGHARVVSSQVERQLRLLRDVLPAYPHGAVRIACSADSDAAPALALARVRASGLRDYLATALPPARLEVAEPWVSADGAGELRLSFGAYAGTAPATSGPP